MSIGRIDLNLMKVFDAVYEDRNLLRAARRLNLSPSAVSHALARLRELVGDELFVRTANGMVPTARSIAMAGDLRESLRKIIATLGAEPFDPLTSTQRFTIASNGHLTSGIVAELSRLMITGGARRRSRRSDPPRASILRSRSMSAGSTSPSAVFQQVPERYSSQILKTQGDLVIMRKRHPAARRKLTLQDLARYPLVTVSVGGPGRGRRRRLHSGAGVGAAVGDVRPACARRQPCRRSALRRATALPCRTGRPLRPFSMVRTCCRSLRPCRRGSAFARRS